MKRTHSLLKFSLIFLSVGNVILLLSIVLNKNSNQIQVLPKFKQESFKASSYSELVDHYRFSSISRTENNAYLDYAKTNFYPDSQLRSFVNELHEKLYGNTHSESPSARLSSDTVAEMRSYILEYLGITETAKYIVVFTYSHAQALKLIAETFNFTMNSTFLYSNTSSNNILGLRGFATQNGAKTASFDIKSEPKFEFENNTRNLIAFPLVDEFDGSTLSTHKMQEIIKAANKYNNTYTLADASLYLPLNNIDLKELPFSALAISFDRLFGYPSMGAAIIKDDFVKTLKKPYFGGGTLVFALPNEDYEKLRVNPSFKLEDGSLPFLSIAALKNGFNLLKETNIGGKVSNIRDLRSRLKNGLTAIKRKSGSNAVSLYENEKSDSILTFNVLDDEKRPLYYRDIVESALNANITLSGGCMNTPGTCMKYLNKTSDDLKKEDFGAIRASLGWASTMQDVDTLINFIKDYINK
ncbi:molybdenum cofactor sulfurase, putative [Trichomonas vaginalis G3]|uniref:Molybdenum cofactor sulfurase, putative n=1 Tax=Trichomonas vaginalis (strain ATCC PRA-98 / G3) TaxID=412133 RepID=A2DKK2_TRIV3|nr:molybdenum cofactor sulfurtransferase protein [Trichomonas vaginalis G3]EAY18985.1 molybdenum cofactor sulfurase, putative [Trichomonas vaginalis G3]KAI5521222.1 molybdenum cofactor sulfurtransferase protein [Trichomonas vaginalis G3]|eukprot:XP_001579971.1 molybdenum cofactor sulfurase [Trichomonas vaginalis G3]